MKNGKSENRFRPMVRRGGTLRRADGPGPAARIAARAGGLPDRSWSLADRATVEQLEPRKLLFALTIDTEDPTFVNLGGGFGQVTAQFGYAIPYLDTNGEVQEEPPEYAEIIEPRLFGAVAVLTGRLGATAQFFDLYNRPMVRTLQVGLVTIEDDEILLIDLNNDGIPDFNDGIGRIELSNTDGDTSFAIWGATIEIAEDIPADALPFPEEIPGSDGQSAFARLVTGLTGNFDAFEEGGFGYQLEAEGGDFTFGGLPPVGGSVIIGSPFVRDLGAYNPDGRVIQGGQQLGSFVNSGFTRANQGIFVNAAAGAPVSMGQVYVHGVMHGTSVFSGALERLYVGYLVGSVNVAGDLGALIVASDAGRWSSETEFDIRRLVKTGGQLVVGRTLGEVSIGGRSSMDVTVIGDLNTPGTRPAGQVFAYSEKETVYGLDPGAQNRDRLLAEFTLRPFGLGATYTTGRPVGTFRQIPYLTYTPPVAFIVGPNFYRNDEILGAEWVGGAGSGVRIEGELSGRDPLNNEDRADVYAFAAELGSQLVIEVQGAPLFRIVDQDGRTLAAPSLFPGRSLAPPGNLGGERTSRVRFTADRSGVFFLVITDPAGGDAGSGLAPYSATITGMAPVALGLHRTGAYFGFNTAANSAVLSVLSGNVGAIMVGAGAPTPTGAMGSPSGLLNPTFDAADDLAGIDDSDDNLMRMRGVSISTTGSLYALITGGDIFASVVQPVSMSIGGNLGGIFTGRSAIPEGGLASENGDVNFLSLSVGGSIGVIDVRGAIGFSQNTSPATRQSVPGLFTVNTGTRGGRGDIGIIRVGSGVNGDVMLVRTSPGSIIGAFLISQDIYDATGGNIPNGITTGNFGIVTNLGAGSDIRFFDTPNITLIGGPDSLIPLRLNETREFVDDNGARVRVTIVGRGGGVGGPILGSVRLLPVNGSLGVAIAQINANLTGGARLEIVGVAEGVQRAPVGIGRIRISGADALSAVDISGPVEVDVYRLEQLPDGGGGGGGGAMDFVSNSTPNGDIVVMDLLGVNAIRIPNGSLGRTELFGIGPRLIGPFLGIVAGYQTTTGAGLGLVNELFTGGWRTGAVYRPVSADDGVVSPTYLDDIGSPFSPFLNGVVIRNGSVLEISVGRQLGDVIMQGLPSGGGTGGGNIGSIIVNGLNVRTPGEFRGIVGSIFADSIGLVNIGQGLAAIAQSPFASSGIFAANDIGQIVGDQVGAFIAAPIIAFNRVFTLGPQAPFNGIQSISLTGGGDFIGAYIGSTDLDDWWQGWSEFDNDGTGNAADLGTLIGRNADFIRSRLEFRSVGDVTLRGGVWDASQLRASSEAGLIFAERFLNSTLDGTDLELVPNEILVNGFVQRLSAGDGRGDISDLTVNVVGGVPGGIEARNIIRSNINVANAVVNLRVSEGFRGSTLIGGSIVGLFVPVIASSTITLSGPIRGLRADRIANTAIAAQGPNGRIDSITARFLLDGSIFSSGPINSLTVTQGSIRASIVTRGPEGSVGTIKASEDVAIRTDLSGGVGTIDAGRHVGDASDPGSIVVNGNLTALYARKGQLYANLRVGGRIINRVEIGAVSNLPGQTNLGAGNIIASGRINQVLIRGDFDGDIISYSGGIGTVRITNGSFMQGNRIAAFVGTLGTLSITGGSLLGSVHADFDINSISITQSRDRRFGDVGVNPAWSVSRATADPFRNELPPGTVLSAQADGPIISANGTLRSLRVAGSMFESGVYAGTIQSVSVSGSVLSDTLTPGRPSFFAASDQIRSVTVRGTMSSTLVLAGVRSLGADGRPGGTGVNADTIGAGSIRAFTVSGAAASVRFLAGMVAGVDGEYGTADDRVAPGLASIHGVTLRGAASDIVASADRFTGRMDPRIVLTGPGLTPVEGRLDLGVGTPGVELPANGITFAYSGSSVTARLFGPGQAFWDSTTGRLTIRSTTQSSRLVVSATPLTAGLTLPLANFDIVSNDDASLGLLQINAALGAGSDIVIDGDVVRAEIATIAGGQSAIGGDVRTLRLGGFTSGTLGAGVVGEFRVNGSFAPASVGQSRPRLDARSINNMVVTGQTGGVVATQGAVNSIAVNAVAGASFNIGTTLRRFSSLAFTESVLAAGTSIDTVTINGDMFRGVILAGVRFGADRVLGGTGDNADVAQAGTLGTITVSGGFPASDISAGVLRGPDNYFGTQDDTAAQGVSTIRSVRIARSDVGTLRPGESYRITATGPIGPVTIGGVNLPGRGNFAVQPVIAAPDAIRVVDLSVGSVSRVFSARMVFNQGINPASIGQALSISEVRGGSLITLTQGSDYTFTYSPETFTLTIFFNTAVTNRNLTGGGTPDPALAGPGVFRFNLSQSVLRATFADSRLDGDGDGVVEFGDDFSQDAFVGDVGDKLAPTRASAGGGRFVDFYGPSSLDQVMDNNRTPDGLPDTNRQFRVTGTVGDHADNDNSIFQVAGDIDVYSITLRAGQILRLSSITGAASRSLVVIAAPDGTPLGFAANPQINASVNDNAFLAGFDFEVTPRTDGRPLSPLSWLVKQSGTYNIIVTNILLSPLPEAWQTPALIPSLRPIPDAIGDYSFTVEVFDDGDSGFTGGTNSGDGENLINAPLPSEFAGADGRFGTADDLRVITRGDTSFSLSADRARVTGSNGRGITSSSDSSGRLTTSILTAIGRPNSAGAPSAVTPDVDVFHLNNRQAMRPGTRVTITLRLADQGSDLGSRSITNFDDLRGSVQLGVFDTTGSVAIDDALLVFSGSDFRPTAQDPRVIANDGQTRYGYDAQGNYFISFLVPEHLTTPGQNGTFAVYVQGVYNTDYQLDIVTEAATEVAVKKSQNVLIETRGGTVDWLERGVISQLERFDASILGFSGLLGDGRTPSQYITDAVVARLNTIFRTNAGFDIQFASDASAFGGGDYSVVYISNSPDPLNLFADAQPFGVSEHVDPLNADRTDEAAVFVPSFAFQGFTNGVNDLDSFAQSLSAAVGRRVGELLGLRITTPINGALPTVVDIMSANVVNRTPFNAPPQLGLVNTPRQLSTAFDTSRSTDFVLGRQTAISLLDRVLNRVT